MRIVVLVDNHSFCALQPEWGLSMWIEFKGKRILLDTGASDLFLKNANALSLPIKEIDYGVLSHAHFDHGNGLPYFFEDNKKACFYLQKSCAENCFKREGKAAERYIGLSKGMLDRYRDRFIFADGVLSPSEDVFLLPHRMQKLWKAGRRERMYRHVGNKWHFDDFSHEQSLVFRTERGLVILSSCSHAGVDHILDEVTEAFPKEPLLAVIGGFHLHNKTREEVLSLTDRLAETSVQAIYTGHCTGDEAFSVLEKELSSAGKQVRQLETGLVMEF